MALSSMTGFARGQGVAGSYAWSWELKSVNAKGLDLRLRLPPGWDAIEVPARARAAEKLARGTAYANVTVERKGVAPTVKVNEPVLNAVLATLKTLSGKVDAAKPTLDGILSLKGVIEVTEEDEREEDRRAAEAAILAGFDKALADLLAMRREEGATLGRLLSARLAEIAALAARAEAAPGRKPEAIKARLAGRPPARFSGAGTQPRIEYADRQGQRRRPHQYRPGIEKRGRAVPRAGAESGVTMAKTLPETAAIARRGLMLVLSSPSGAGKTTLSRRLLEQDKGVTLSVSVTTRKIRPGEVDGRDYTFIDRRRFDALVEKDELLEWAEVFDNYYGTPAKPVMDALAQGRDVLFDIDWQGTQQLREKARGDLVAVFVLPPSIPELERRLKSRAQDDYETIHRRMAKAADEMSHWAEYDYVVINRDLDQAFADVKAVLAAERLKRERQPGLSDFVRGLQAKL